MVAVKRQRINHEMQMLAQKHLSNFRNDTVTQNKLSLKCARNSGCHFEDSDKLKLQFVLIVNVNSKL